MKMGTHYIFKGICKVIAGISPVTDLLQPQDCRASEFRRIKILMSDRVSPSIQLLKPVLTVLIAYIQILHFVPERKPELIVVSPNVSGIRITYHQLPVLNKNIPERCSQKARWNALHEVVRTFRVQVTTVSLKLGREQNGVCLINLLSGITPSATRATDAPVGSFHLIEGGPPHGPPSLQRHGRHHASRYERMTG
jgi:hypothetical protein